MGTAHFPSSFDPPRRTGAEMRDSPRLPEDRPAWIHRGSHAFSVTMRDVSRSGACFLATRPLALGQALRLQLGNESVFAATEATVVRNVERPDGLFEIGVRFNKVVSEAAIRFPRRIARVACF